jgi:hypothetical protein
MGKILKKKQMTKIGKAKSEFFDPGLPLIELSEEEKDAALTRRSKVAIKALFRLY